MALLDEFRKINESLGGKGDFTDVPPEAQYSMLEIMHKINQLNHQSAAGDDDYSRWANILREPAPSISDDELQAMERGALITLNENGCKITEFGKPVMQQF
jgi:hypothetical protein